MSIKIKITTDDIEKNPGLRKPKRPSKPKRGRTEAVKSTYGDTEITSFVNRYKERSGAKFYMRRSWGKDPEVVASYYLEDEDKFKKRVAKYKRDLNGHDDKVKAWQKSVARFEKKKLIEKLAEIERARAQEVSQINKEIELRKEIRDAR